MHPHYHGFELYKIVTLSFFFFFFCVCSFFFFWLLGTAMDTDLSILSWSGQFPYYLKMNSVFCCECSKGG